MLKNSLLVFSSWIMWKGFKLLLNPVLLLWIMNILRITDLNIKDRKTDDNEFLRLFPSLVIMLPTESNKCWRKPLWEEGPKKAGQNSRTVYSKQRSNVPWEKGKVSKNARWPLQINKLFYQDWKQAWVTEDYKEVVQANRDQRYSTLHDIKVMLPAASCPLRLRFLLVYVWV